MAERIGTPLMPWQQHVADVAFELNPDGSFAYSEIGLEVGRQEGKTALKFVVMLHRLVGMVPTHGPQRVTYTMQNRLKARTRLERDYAVRLRGARGFKEIPAKARVRPTRQNQWRLGMNSGVEHIQFGPSSYMQIDTPSRTGGHGDTLDLGAIDEAFAHEDDTVEVGMEPALLIPADSQLWVMSAAGDRRSKYLYRKVLAGRELVEEGADTGTCYFEWSAPDDAEAGDPAVWASACPALGIVHADGSGLTEAKLAARWAAAQRKGQEGIDLFRRSYLCQWPEIPVLDDVGGGAIDVERWLYLADPSAARGKRVTFGVDVGSDRLAHVAVAWKRPDGAVQVMMADTGLSPLETPERLSELAKAWRGPVMLGGPAADLADDVRNSQIVNGAEFAAACGRFDDLFTAGKVHHGNQPELNEAIRSAKWQPSGNAGARSIQLRNSPEVGPLAAVIRALHGVFATARPPAAPLLAETVHAGRSETGDLSTLQF